MRTKLNPKAIGLLSNIGPDPLENYKTTKVRKTAKIRNQYNQVPHLAEDTTLESDKITIRHHKQEPRGEPFPKPTFNVGWLSAHHLNGRHAFSGI